MSAANGTGGRRRAGGRAPRRRRWSGSRGRLVDRLASTRRSLEDAWLRTAGARSALRARWAPVGDFVTPLGTLVIALAVIAFVLGGVLGWAEFVLAGYLVTVVLLCCVALTIGRTELHVALSVTPRRIQAGDTADGRLEVLNLRGRRVLPIVVEVPVGRGTGRFTVPAVSGHGRYDKDFEIPTERRGVITVGPASTVRGDPFGLLHRTVRWTDSVELFVHPRLARLPSLDAGLLRDLEGRTTSEMSVSDLAFHALRDYVPGDDRRFIHWRSSARVSAQRGTSTFLVRQFLDTRRSQLCVVVDADDRSYEDDEEFELAMSAGASVAVGALREEIQATVVVADQTVADGSAQRVLDGFARAQPRRVPLAMLAADAVRAAPATSLAVLVTGDAADFAEVRRAAAQFPSGVTTVVLRVDTGRSPGISSVSGLTLLSISQLADLPRLLGVGMAA